MRYSYGTTVIGEELASLHAGRLVDLDPWVVGPSLTVREMEECLSRCGIRYQVTGQADWDDFKCTVAGAGATLIFAGEQWLPRALSHSKVTAS